MMHVSQLRLTHLSLGVSDIVTSERFYRETLGLATHRVDDVVEVRWNDFLLILNASPPAGRGKFHFGFRVDTAEEVAAWAARLRDRGVEIVVGPSSDKGRTHLFFIDPDDYQLEIYSESD
ncbi:MAG TPA: VOC family protein [Candidatus Baltobacteraceae bacterium]|nr:VOC family protein [Candidatus Baltobacteraceae bacterium]